MTVTTAETIPSDFYIGNRVLHLGKSIGRGGEGEVFLLTDEPGKAVKLYRPQTRADREAKVRAMVDRNLAAASTLVAFPEAAVTTGTGQFAGFTMQLVEGFHQLHELYGPRSRKLLYPKADFRFLVRVAANVARAVGQVHRSSCVIGDLNESGLLVSQQATVALIDADSFQFTAGGKRYSCMVGKVEYTAPELHGKSLAGRVRTETHDYFGLAVAIFQLLFMGRHPYAGQKQGSDMTLDQMVGANLFAYSEQRHVGVDPPQGMSSLEDFPPEIADAFERAFGLDPMKRPTAAEWGTLLQRLEEQLAPCPINGAHVYPAAAKQCPWCRMEEATGVVLFLPSAARGGDTVDLETFDVDKIWEEINAMVLPNSHSVLPPLPEFRLKASAEAREAKSSALSQIFRRKLGAAALGIGAVVGIAAAIGVGQMFISLFLSIVSLAALIGAFFYFFKRSMDMGDWEKRYHNIDSKWNTALDQWRNTLGAATAVKLRNEIRAAVFDYRSLGAEKAQAVVRLKSERHNRQLHEFLDNFLIEQATISGIGTTKQTMLASFGIETAADIKRHAVLNVPSFTQTDADRLMAWRAEHEQRFVYNPAHTKSDDAAQARLDVDFANRAAALAQQIVEGQEKLARAVATLQARMGVEDRRLVELAARRAQLRVDLAYLGVED